MKKNSLVIFLHQNVWDQNSLEALEVEKFLKNSNVVAYELGHFINKNIVSVFKNKLHKKYIKKIRSYSEWKTHFVKLIKNYDSSKILIINKVRPTNIWSFLVLLELSNLKINIVETKNSGVPNFVIKKRYFERIKDLKNILYLLSTVQGKFFNFLFKFIKFYNYSYLISGRPNEQFKNRKFIHGSSWDMAKTFNKNKKLNIKNKFAVYIESTVAHTGDGVILGPNSPVVDKKKWFRSLNQFFYNFEKKYNLKVIIAAHPKIGHSKFSKYYKHRKVIKNKTKELIFNSKFVFFERSSAINFIIKYNKPAAMIYNNDSISTPYNKKTHIGFSNLTGIRNIDFEKYLESDLEDLFVVDRSKYLKYYKEFINYKNLKIPNYQILRNKFLKKLYD